MQEDIRVEESSLPEISEPLRELPNATDDIPIAVRETPVLESQAPKQKTFLWGLAGASAAALIAIGLAAGLRPQSATVPVANANSPSNATDNATDATTGADQSAAESRPTASTTENLLGHLPYSEAPKEELEPIAPDGSLLLRKPAAEKFLEMQAAARADGVELVPLSGFRSEAEQEHVFFDVKAERGQDTETRSEVSAPPGYSEHHTGYAIDIGDGNRSDLDLQTEFEQTAAFQWLKQHAAHYSFEISFPKDNPMQVSYEPWHWRFVGDRQSLETFYRAKAIGQ
jgi:zinc D-Ala-D-Ala carboxypeptidase